MGRGWMRKSISTFLKNNTLVFFCFLWFFVYGCVENGKVFLRKQEANGHKF